MRPTPLVMLAFGCAPTTMSATPRSITIDGVTQFTMANATQRAQDHCERYGRDAEYVPDARSDGIATFRCVDGDGPAATGPTITPAEERRRQQLERQLAADKPKAAPRGFFCSTTETTGFCVRDKAECLRTRDVSIAALPDLSECALTEAAWCTGDLCFPTQEVCDARVASAGSGAGCERRE